MSVTYPNGDAIRVEFFQVEDGEQLSKRYKNADSALQGLAVQGGDVYPLTVVEVRMRVRRSRGNGVLNSAKPSNPDSRSPRCNTRR